jgi:hypothetical protein
MRRDHGAGISSSKPVLLTAAARAADRQGAEQAW